MHDGPTRPSVELAATGRMRCGRGSTSAPGRFRVDEAAASVVRRFLAAWTMVEWHSQWTMGGKQSLINQMQDGGERVS